MLLALLLLSVWGVGAARAQVADQALPGDTSTKAVAAAHEVLQVFYAKCFTCHDASQGKPKGGFGHVMDLAKLAADTDLVVPGKPEDSELWVIVDFDEMPPADSIVEPLTDEEKQAIRNWIAVGAPVVAWSPPAAQEDTAQQSEQGGTAVLAVAATRPAASEGAALAKRLGRWMGKLHPASVHLPIAMILAAVLAEALLLITGRQAYQDIVRFCLWLGVIGGVGAAVLGWLHAEHGVFIGERATALFWHRWLGVAGVVGLIIVALMSEMRYRLQPERARAFRIALLIVAAIIIAGGYLGGGLTHGLDHYFQW